MGFIFSSILFFTVISLAKSARVNIDQTKLTIQKNSKSVLTFTLDEPIICSYSSIYNCKVSLLLTNPNPSKLSLDVCQINWNWNEWTQPRYVNVTAVENFVNDMPFSGTIVTSPIISNSDYYSGFNPVDILVQTVFRPSATCSGTGDPHYTTFDGAYWHVYWAGTYVLYKSTQREFEVQVATRGYPAQHCGFAARENNDVVVVYACDGKMIQRRTCGSSTCLSGSFPKVKVSGSSFSVQFASGASATLNYYNSIYGNMYVTAPGQDYMSTVGVCGNFNGNKNDDAPYNNFFATSTNQMPEGTIPSYDLFNFIPSGIIDEVSQPSELKCQYVSTPVIIPILNNPDIEDITNLIKESSTQITTPPTFVITESPITVDKELMFLLCNKTISESIAAKTCKEVILNFDIAAYIESCTEDMFLSNGDKTFIQITVDGLIQDCKSEANRDTNTWVKDENGNLIEPNIQIQINLCPTVNNKLCSGNGNCVQAVCVCKDGFTGSDCSIDKLNPPIIFSQSYSTCDTHGLLNCPTEISVYGMNFWNSPNLRCNFGNISTSAFYMGSLQVICKVPRVSVIGVSPVTLPITIETDKDIISVSTTNFTYYDASCIKCNFDKCETNPTSCNINGKCYIDTQVSSNLNVCLKCLSKISQKEFSYDYSSSIDCGPRFEQTLMNSRIVGTAEKGMVFYKVNAKNPLLTNDPLNKITYKITSGFDLFGINQDTGELFTTYDCKISDLPKNIINNIIITAIDNANNTATAQVLVNLISTNNNPIFSSEHYEFNVNETIPVKTTVGFISAKDNDSGEFGTIKYEINYIKNTQGVGSHFEIDTNTGEIFSTRLLDFYTVSSYEYIGIARDGGGQYYMSSVKINLLMVNRPPTKIFLNNINVKELQLPFTKIDSIQVIDREDKNFTFEILDNTNFKIVDGILFTNKTFIVGKDANPQELNIRVNDSVNNSLTQKIFINIIQVNKAPFNIGLSKTDFSENSMIDSILAEVFFTELDENQKVYCSISNEERIPFIISPNYLILKENLNYGMKKNYNISITCVDDGEPSMMGVSFVNVNIIYFPSGPSDVTFISETIDEYSSINSLVGILKATSIDFNTTDMTIESVDKNYLLNYKECLKNQPYGVICKINVYSNNILDYENPIPLNIIIKSNNGIEREYSLNIPIKDLNEAPNGINWIKENIDEEGGLFSIEDPDYSNNFEVTTTTPGFNIDKLDDNIYNIKTTNIVYYDTNFTISIIVKNDEYVSNFLINGLVIKAQIKIWIDKVGRNYINLNETTQLNSKIGDIILSNLDTKNYLYTCSSNSNYTIINNLNQMILVRKLDSYENDMIMVPVKCSFKYVGMNNPQKNNLNSISSDLTINVEFINEAPFSLFDSYQIDLDRDTNLGATLNVVPPIDVKDREGNSITFELEIDSDEFKELIKINKNTGRIYLGKLLSTVIDSFDTNNQMTIKLKLYDAFNKNNVASYPITVSITDGCTSNPCGSFTCLRRFKSYECDCGEGRFSMNCTENALTIQSSNKMSSSSVAGLVIGSILLFLIIVGIAIIYFKKSKQSNKMDLYEKERILSMDNPTFINPNSFINNSEESFSNPIYYGEKRFMPGVANPIYSWYNPDFSREESEDYLKDKEIGTFMIHDSKATPGWHIFSLKNDEGVLHEKIKYSEDGLYELVPSNNNGPPQPKFYNLPSLVEYYTSSIMNPMYIMNNDNIYKVVTSNKLCRINDFKRRLYLEEDPNAPPLPLKQKHIEQLNRIMVP
jgi:hypothetical protein